MIEEKINILVTGGAGFIGSHLVDKLSNNNFSITVVDNFDSFYSYDVKKSNIANYINKPNIQFLELDITIPEALESIPGNFDVIVHLAAKAGVRPSIIDPISYQEVNVRGTLNMLEFATKHNIKQFIFCSSSSVYGVNKNIPWKEGELTLNPISPYASSKMSAELIGHVYSHLYNLRFIALRLFTVYGPRQRPDLAIHSFSRKLLKGDTIQIFGDGSTARDYTYVADTVQGIYNALFYDRSNYEVFNLGNNYAVPMRELIQTMEDVFQIKANLAFLPEQPGDVPITLSDISKAQLLLNYNPTIRLKEGMVLFREWLLSKSVFI